MGQGKKGKSKGKVHPVFKDRLDHLKENAGNQAESFRQSEQRKWQVPDELQADDVFDVANLHQQAFDRTEINDNYVDCVSSPKDAGTTGDVISLKLQLDYNAAEERAFRARHASPIRNMCHAMARRKYQKEGPTFDAVEKQAADAIAAGAV